MISVKKDNNNKPISTTNIKRWLNYFKDNIKDIDPKKVFQTYLVESTRFRK